MPTYTRTNNRFHLTAKHSTLRKFLLDELQKFALATGWARSTIGQYLIGNPRVYTKIITGGLQVGTADDLLGRMREAIAYHKKNGRWPDPPAK